MSFPGDFPFIPSYFIPLLPLTAKNESPVISYLPTLPSHSWLSYTQLLCHQNLLFITAETLPSRFHLCQRFISRMQDFGQADLHVHWQPGTDSVPSVLWPTHAHVFAKDQWEQTSLPAMPLIHPTQVRVFAMDQWEQTNLPATPLFTLHHLLPMAWIVNLKFVWWNFNSQYLIRRLHLKDGSLER